MTTPARGRMLRIARPFDEDADDDRRVAESTLPGTSGGLIAGLAMISAVSWICTAALVEPAHPRVIVLLVVAMLLVLLIVPSSLRTAGAPEISRAAVASQYGGFAALGLLGWSTLLWAPDRTWAAMAAVGVLQGGYTLGVGLVAVQSRLVETVVD